MHSSRPLLSSAPDEEAPYSPVETNDSLATGVLEQFTAEVDQRDTSSSHHHHHHTKYNPGLWPGDARIAGDRALSASDLRSQSHARAVEATASGDRPLSAVSPSVQPAPAERAWYLDDSDDDPGSNHLDKNATTNIPEVQYASNSENEDLVQGSSREESPVPRVTKVTLPHLGQPTTADHMAYISPSNLEQDQQGPSRDQLASMTSSSRAASPKPPNLMLSAVQPDDLTRSDSKKKSPGIGGFFGWRKGSPTRPESPSPTTTFSDSRSVSPGPSPFIKSQNKMGSSDDRQSPSGLGEVADYFSQVDSHYGPQLPTEGIISADPAHTDELIRELKEISAELAASIKREMELEDHIEKYKAEVSSVPGTGLSRRTSDYYSDSGISSMPIPLADSDFKIETLENLRRKAEQDKAQLKLDFSYRAQHEMNRRRALEMQYKELETSLEHTRRRLHEERKFKENFEDLITGMKQEIESCREERDSLRDEVVPQLRFRIEGMQAQTAEMQNLTSENTRIQQENQSLRNENQNLVNARRLQLDLQQTNSRFKSIAEEDEPGSPRSPGGAALSRSNSLARSKSIRNRSGSISRAKEGLTPIEATADSFKDLEDQRDALHRTLKGLLLRHDHMTRKHDKHVHALQLERDRALAERKRRAAFQIEIQYLRSELNHLRRRADDAMEQKWQCEKGLSGLKMDLDRAQQETTSLKEIVDEKTELEPSRSVDTDKSEVGKTLDIAYSSLKEVHAKSIERLRAEPGSTDAIESASQRMHILSQQIEDQLSTNAGLRERLREAIERGVSEQAASAAKIINLETALRAAEEQVLTAANQSEEALSQQEDYARAMREAADEQARRGLTKSPLHVGAQTQAQRESGSGLGVILSPRSSTMLSPELRTPLFAIKSPRLANTSSGKGISATEASHTENLEQLVSELERAARKADAEMQGVVEKMNQAQIEVAVLQGERDEAMRQTKQLQREIVEERERMKALTN